MLLFFFFFQAEDGIRDLTVTGVQTCALPIWWRHGAALLRQNETVQGEMRGTRYRTGSHGGLKLRTCFQPLHASTPFRGSVQRANRPAMAGLRRPDACGPWRGER